MLKQMFALQRRWENCQSAAFDTSCISHPAGSSIPFPKSPSPTLKRLRSPWPPWCAWRNSSGTLPSFLGFLGTAGGIEPPKKAAGVYWGSTFSGVGFYVPMFHITQLQKRDDHLQQMWLCEMVISDVQIFKKSPTRKGHLLTQPIYIYIPIHHILTL